MAISSSQYEVDPPPIPDLFANDAALELDYPPVDTDGGVDFGQFLTDFDDMPDSGNGGGDDDLFANNENQNQAQNQNDQGLAQAQAQVETADDFQLDLEDKSNLQAALPASPPLDSIHQYQRGWRISCGEKDIFPFGIEDEDEDSFGSYKAPHDSNGMPTRGKFYWPEPEKDEFGHRMVNPYASVSSSEMFTPEEKAEYVNPEDYDFGADATLTFTATPVGASWDLNMGMGEGDFFMNSTPTQATWNSTAVAPIAKMQPYPGSDSHSFRPGSAPPLGMGMGTGTGRYNPLYPLRPEHLHELAESTMEHYDYPPPTLPGDGNKSSTGTPYYLNNAGMNSGGYTPDTSPDHQQPISVSYPGSPTQALEAALDFANGRFSLPHHLKMQQLQQHQDRKLRRYYHGRGARHGGADDISRAAIFNNHHQHKHGLKDKKRAIKMQQPLPHATSSPRKRPAPRSNSEDETNESCDHVSKKRIQEWLNNTPIDAYGGRVPVSAAAAAAASRVHRRRSCRIASQASWKAVASGSTSSSSLSELTSGTDEDDDDDDQEEEDQQLSMTAAANLAATTSKIDIAKAVTLPTRRSRNPGRKSTIQQTPEVEKRNRIRRERYRDNLSPIKRKLYDLNACVAKGLITVKSPK